MQISKEKIEQYNQEGYTIVENVFSKNELKPVLLVILLEFIKNQ